jgi:hypothetical protein
MIPPFREIKKGEAQEHKNRLGSCDVQPCGSSALGPPLFSGYEVKVFGCGLTYNFKVSYFIR